MTDPVSVLKFVAASNVLGERLLTERSTLMREKSASDALRRPLFEQLVRQGHVPQGQEKAAEELLATYRGTQELLKAALDRIGRLEAQAVQKQASDLGRAEAPERPGYNDGGYRVVGARDGGPRESDRLWMSILDDPSAGR